MSTHSKSARLLVFVSVLALASACGEGAEPQELPEQAAQAHAAPDELKEVEQAAGSIPAGCPQCESRSDFWFVAADGTAGGWACGAAYPWTYFSIYIYKKTWSPSGWYWRQIGSGWADGYNSALASVCGGSPYHQFIVYVGPTNAGPGEYKMQAVDVTGTMYGSVDYVNN